MQFTVLYLNTNVLAFSSGLMLLMLMLAFWRAPWGALLHSSVRQHALLGSLVLLSLIWSFRFEVLPGLYFHPFLTVALTLVFGVPLSLITGAVAAILVALVGKGQWMALPLDWLFTVVVPTGLSFVLLWLLAKLPTRNLFVYILGLGFFGALLVTGINCLLLLAFFYCCQPEGAFQDLWENIAFTIPLIYSEGFINGVLVTSITVYAPDLVKTFDDQRFLKS